MLNYSYVKTRSEIMDYNPKDEAFDEIVICKDILNDIENISENVHNAWAREKFSNGWKYGDTVNTVLKTHPSLIPYEKLSEEQKELDRTTSKQVIKSLIKLGYKISR